MCAKDKDGSTAAHWAFTLDHNALGDWLLCQDDGLSEIEDNDGRTPASVNIDFDEMNEQEEPLMQNGLSRVEAIESCTRPYGRHRSNDSDMNSSI